MVIHRETVMNTLIVSNYILALVIDLFVMQDKDCGGNEGNEDFEAVMVEKDFVGVVRDC